MRDPVTAAQNQAGQSKSRLLRAACDGASQGNPGPAGIGCVITDTSGRILQEISEPIGCTTNNQAEYRALIRALEAALDLGATCLQIQLDSELVVLQMQGHYRVRNPGLRPLWEQASSLVARFTEVCFTSVPREMNTRADRLASSAATVARMSARPARPSRRQPRLPMP